MGTAIGGLLEKKEITLDFLRGRRVGVDSLNVLYQFLSSIRGQDGMPLMDSQGKVTSHLTGLLYRTTNLLQKGIKPVFVFDGEPHPLKRETLEERKKIRTEAIEAHEKALKEGDMEKARSMGSRALKMTREMVDEAKELVKAMGLPVVEAAGEGEAQVSWMAEKGDVFGCVSQDYDALLFGATTVLRNITVSGRRKLPGRNVFIDVSPEMISLEECLEKLGIDRRKLVWLGMLVGTDFNEKFPGIGPKRGLKLVQESGSFEDIIRASGHEPGFDYMEVEKIFLEPAHTEEYDLSFRAPDKDKVIEFLCEGHSFSRERVESALSKLQEKADEKGEQSTLSKWG